MLNKTVPLCLSLVFLLTVFPGAQNRVGPRELYDDARSAQQNEQYYRAIELYRTILEEAPNYIDPIIGLADTYFYLEEYDEALQWVQQAKRYNQNDPHIIILEGRIHIALGNYDQAEDRFQQVLEREPYNIAAQFGLAELNIVLGKTEYATNRYLEALNYSPLNKRALLSLMLVYDARGNRRQAEEYIRTALHHYSHDPQVHYFAAKHYFTYGDLTEAELQAKTSISLKPDYTDAIHLLSKIYLHSGRYEEVVPLLNEVLKTDRENHLLWYTLGYAYGENGEYDRSINSFTRAFRIRTDDEISRMALEYILINHYNLDDPLRSQYAAYHFDKGQTLEERNFFRRAREEYRRGLRIDPFSVRGRLLYADIIDKMGEPARYLSQLKLIIDDLEYTDVDILDEYEIQKSLQEDSVANRWGVRQFPPTLKESRNEQFGINQTLPMERFQYRCLLFYSDKSTLRHVSADRTLAHYIRDQLLHYETIDVINEIEQTDSFSKAFRQAREADAHYFLIVTFHETTRSFATECELFSAVTGDKIKEYRYYRTGNDKVTEALKQIGTDFFDDLPLRGRFVDRRFDSGLVNVGSYDGIEEEDELALVKAGSITLKHDVIGLNYNEEALLGSFTVTEADELIAEGTISTEMFFDMINPGDEIIEPPPEEEDEAAREEQTGRRLFGGRREEEAEEAIRSGRTADLYEDLIKID
jgi:tetratricopeptide (TPR) repeat protein